MQQKTLQQFIDRVAYEAGIDGQVTTTGRHSFANLTNLFNETWDSLLSLAARNGQVEAQTVTSEAGSALPASANNEDYIIIPWPTTAVEIVGVDVFFGGEDGWQDLYPISFNSRRLIKNRDDEFGYHAIKKLPKENGTSVDAGELAVFPACLAGRLHKVLYRETWLPIPAASTTFTIVGYPDWFQWAQNEMVRIITKRDTNKKDTFTAATLMKNEAQARIEENSKMRQHKTRMTPRRRDGWDL